MKSILFAGIAVAALAGLAPAAAQTATAPGKPAAAAKPVTRADVAAKAQQQFTKLDANKDGFLTKAEAEAALSARHANIEKRLDKRGDARFARFDSNKDGKITRAEAEAGFAARKGAGKTAKAAPTWDKFAGGIDTNKDGAISAAEFDAAHAKRADLIADRGSRRGFAGQMFVTADTNKDGRVSLAEATATATAQFDKADANKDGSLTRDEVRSARQVAAKKPAGR